MQVRARARARVRARVRARARDRDRDRGRARARARDRDRARGRARATATARATARARVRVSCPRATPADCGCRRRPQCRRLPYISRRISQYLRMQEAPPAPPPADVTAMGVRELKAEI